MPHVLPIFFCVDPSTTEIYPLSLHDALPISSGGGAPEVYALGLRNPWGFSQDEVTGELWVGDVGQNNWEEIDKVRSEEHTSELQSLRHLVCRLLLEKKKWVLNTPTVSALARA